MDQYIEENSICINDLILAELTPLLRIKKQTNLITLLENITHIPLNIRWRKIIDHQVLCLQNGMNHVGIADLIIVDQVIQNDLLLYTLDSHFTLMNQFIRFKII